MPLKCYHVFPNGHGCEKWAKNGSRFCHHHQPPEHLSDSPDLKLHPHARLGTPEDLFNFIRESLCAVRLGSTSPGQAFAVCQLADRWMKFYRLLGYADSKRALEDLILPTLVDATSAAAAERAAALTDEAERQTADAERDIVHQAELALIIKHGPAIIPFLTGGGQPSASDDQALDHASPSPPDHQCSSIGRSQANESPDHPIVNSSAPPAPESVPAPSAISNHPITKSPNPQISQSTNHEITGSPGHPISQSPDGSPPNFAPDFAERIISHFERQALRSLLRNTRQRTRDG